MRNLILLRGIPAAGKSTWVKENNYEGHVVSLDDFRDLITGKCCLDNPDEPDKCFENIKIDQTVTSTAVKMLYTVVEERMKEGRLVMVDATHLKNADIDNYKKLTEKYRYRTTIVDFPVSKEEAIKRDSQRPLHKQVGADVINRLCERRDNQDLSKYKVVNKDDFREAIKWRTENFNDKIVNVFGDMHGCLEPFEDFLKEHPFSDKEIYIFLGDYLDRGKQNKDTLEKILKLSKKENCIFLEGNHEKWLSLYAHNRAEEIRSKDFLNETMSQIQDIDKGKIRQFCRNLRQILMFEQDGQKYLLSHGGISYCPDEHDIPFVPTQKFIKGVGGYERDVDGDYEREALNKENYPIQIHGHRNINYLNAGTKHSVNLEGRVENGGVLRVWRDGEILEYKNNYMIKENDFFHNPLINVKDLGTLKDGRRYYSCNFTKEAFFDRRWDDATTKARGLFIAEKDDKKEIIARGYEKFFNIGEREQDTVESLKTGKPIVAYKKENGFLGMVACIDDELHFFSKSTDKGDYAKMCKEQVMNALGDNAENFKNCLKAGNMTATFEIIDIEKDPHIIEYDKSKAVLLDIINNSLEFNRIPYNKLKEVGDIFNLETKQVYREWKDYDTFKNWYDTTKSVGTGNVKDLEGLVIESGNYMCKMKFDYYLQLKEARRDLERIKDGREPKNNNDFTKWMKENPEKLTNIIDAHKEYEKFYDNERERG